ncbi:MAG TPA: hypothetical protein VKB19_01175, partial [Pedobacter sp.]|nr:hypothetical protein [Pedobacter sp.]
VASANCKDQVGTDGYTLWGGYWNQAYYPSRINSYMPAQNEKNQLPVPVFRMLGSDPIRQYDHGLGSDRQGVITLEPVYPAAGGDEAWVKWFFKQLVEGEAMEFGYAQAGQENSFTWNGMSKGFEIQMPLIASLRDQKKIRVETLLESGKWFRKRYKITPATSVTVNEDLDNSDRKTVWFNSRFYRTNLLWENGKLNIRDIHLFDETFPSVYTENKATSNECSFFTLPFVDGYIWSKPNEIAGLRFKTLIDGTEVSIEGGNPTIKSLSPGKLRVTWPLTNINGSMIIDMDEKQMNIRLEGYASAEWFLDLTTAKQAILPFLNVEANKISCSFENKEYGVTALAGSFEKPEGTVFRLVPSGQQISLNLAERK